jgi:hypothetical protein
VPGRGTGDRQCGSPAKVAYLENELGFDAAFDYHDGPAADRLRELAPEGISVFFDVVGGEQYHAALRHLAGRGPLRLPADGHQGRGRGRAAGVPVPAPGGLPGQRLGAAVVTVLSSRALNRALLDRQFLLARTDRTPLEVIGRLVALQAQEPNWPYVGLGSSREGH